MILKKFCYISILKMPTSTRNLRSKVAKILKDHNRRNRTNWVTKELPNGHIILLLWTINIIPKEDQNRWIRKYKSAIVNSM